MLGVESIKKNNNKRANLWFNCGLRGKHQLVSFKNRLSQANWFHCEDTACGFTCNKLMTDCYQCLTIFGVKTKSHSGANIVLKKTNFS